MKRQQGFSIVTAIFVLVVLGLLGGYMVKLSTVQTSTFNTILQGARCYQATKAGIEWAIARIGNGGSCGDINAQTALSFTGLDGFSVRLSCSSQSHSEAERTLNVYRINALGSFGNYADSGYVARELEVTLTR